MHALELAGGLLVIGLTVYDVFQSIIVPRPSSRALRLSSFITRYSWRAWRRCGALISVDRSREAFLGIFGPLTIIGLLAVWVVGLVFGYGLIFFALSADVRPEPTGFGSALYFAGTSLLTLGFGDIVATGGLARFFSLAAAATGLATVAVSITFLYSLFGSFQRREIFVITLDARAGAPPSGIAMLETHAELGIVGDLPRAFAEAQLWAAEILESHLAYPILGFFRSSHVDESWVGALGAILDAATLLVTTVEAPAGQARVFVDVGIHLTHDLSRYFGLRYFEDVGVERYDFEHVRDRLAVAGYGLRDADSAWASFVKLRMEYAPALNAMARYWAIPPAQWIGDRSTIARH